MAESQRLPGLHTTQIYSSELQGLGSGSSPAGVW